MNILQLYERLEGLVSKLPAPLQKPILQELNPLKTLFLARRSPRVALMGEGGQARAAVINALFGANVVDATRETQKQMGWHDVTRLKKGSLRILDIRGPTASNMLKNALVTEPPDLFLFVRSSGGGGADMDFATKILEFLARRDRPLPGIIGVLASGNEPAPSSDAVADEFRTSLQERVLICEHLRSCFQIPASEGFGEDGTLTPERRKAVEPLAEAILDLLPDEARLEMARLSGIRSVQARIAQVLIKSAAAICTAIGTQPIPLADFPILTSLQVMMVAGIMYISGRELSTKLAAEFIGAMGANIGTALVLREGSRALLKLLPGWGNAISGGIAGAGTYAIGKSASAFFIDGLTFNAARALSRKKRDLVK